MAYQYVSATGRARHRSARWTSISILNTTLLNIYATYKYVVIKLTNEYLPGPVYFDLIAHKPLVNPNLTLAQWLTANGNSALTATVDEPEILVHKAVYRDARLSNYDITRVAPTGSPSSNSPEGTKVDLLLTRSDINYLDFANYCLVTVNGYIHRIEGSVDGVYIRDGYQTVKVSKSDNIGILSFKNLGNIEIIPITADMLYKPTNQPYIEKAYIDTGVDLTNHTVMIVIGGYLHILDDSYKVVSSTSICINTDTLMIPERIMDSRNECYLRDTLSPFINNQSIATANLLSDSLLIEYLTLSQSFIIKLNAANVVTNPMIIENCELAGRYICKQIPILPLFNRLGRLSPYWPISFHNDYVIATDTSEQINYRFNTSDWNAFGVMDGSYETNNPKKHTTAYFLEICTEQLI